VHQASGRGFREVGEALRWGRCIHALSIAKHGLVLGSEKLHPALSKGLMLGCGLAMLALRLSSSFKTEKPSG